MEDRGKRLVSLVPALAQAEFEKTGMAADTKGAAVLTKFDAGEALLAQGVG